MTTKVTKKMRDAGFEVLCMYDSELGDARETAVRVYRAMDAARFDRTSYQRELMRKRRAEGKA